MLHLRNCEDNTLKGRHEDMKFDMRTGRGRYGICTCFHPYEKNFCKRGDESNVNVHHNMTTYNLHAQSKCIYMTFIFLTIQKETIILDIVIYFVIDLFCD